MLKHIAIAGQAFLHPERTAGCPHPHEEPRGWCRPRVYLSQAPGFFSAPGHHPFWVGTGISIYGLIYFLILQVLMHRRIKVFNKLFHHVYLKAIYLACQGHEGSSLKNQTGTAGLLGVPVKYLPLAQRNNKHV
jgi:beta-carotene 3-hydroxylase